MAQVIDLLERVRARLGDEPLLREVKMFGGISFMVRELMVVAVRKDGTLLVHVDKSEGEQLVNRPGASIAEMGKGRSMGPGWISVEPAALTEPGRLDEWLDVALAFNRRQSAEG